MTFRTHLLNLDSTPTNLIRLRLLPPPSFHTRTHNRQVQTMVGGKNLSEWCQTQCLTLIGVHEAGLVVGVADPVKVFRLKVTAWELLNGRKIAGLAHKLHQMLTILVLRRVRGGETLCGEALVAHPAIAFPSLLPRYRAYRICTLSTITHIPRKLERSLYEMPTAS